MNVTNATGDIADCVKELSSFRERHFGDKDSQFLLENQVEAYREANSELYDHLMICRTVIAQILAYKKIGEYLKVGDFEVRLPEDAFEVLAKKGVKQQEGRGFAMRELLNALPPLDAEANLGPNRIATETLTKNYLDKKAKNAAAVPDDDHHSA